LTRIRELAKEIIVGSIFFFILINIISFFRQPQLTSNHIPQETVKLLDGSKYRLKSGKPLVIHFWATWCPTCKLESPNIEALSKKYEVLTVAVNSGNNEKIARYMKENSLTFNVLNDSAGQWAKKFKVEAYPTTFMYDAKGMLQFTEVGYTSTAGFLGRMLLLK